MQDTNLQSKFEGDPMVNKSRITILPEQVYVKHENL